jgi:hypothetical protein
MKYVEVAVTGSGYVVGKVSVESDGVGWAKGVFHCDDGTKIAVCLFKREGDRWIDPKFPSRKLKQSSRLDWAVHLFYEGKSYIEFAVLHSNYDRRTKGEILLLLVELRQWAC